MKQKEVILWVVAVGALCLSFLAIFGPKLQGVKSQAARMQYTVQQQQAPSALSDGTAKVCHKVASEEFRECLANSTQGTDDDAVCAVTYLAEAKKCDSLFTPVETNQ